MALDRYYPMNWAPRWVDAFYEDSSVLKGLYYYSTRYHTDYLARLTRNVVPQFYGEIREPSQIFIANYSYDKKYLPHLTLSLSGNISTINLADTLGSFNYEQILPIAFLDNNSVLLKNLNTISVTAMVTSGYCNLSTQLSNQPAETDSPFVFVNSWGDHQIIDQTSSTYFPASGEFLLPYDGQYTIYYRSLTFLNRLSSSLDFIQIDGKTIEIYQKKWDNSWDQAIQYHGYNRHCFESNNVLKQKIQHLSIAKEPIQKISAVLGTTIGITWNTSSIVNLVGSGITDFKIQGYSPYTYLTEQPKIVDSKFLLLYPPSGNVQIFIRGSILKEQNYVVSGSYITPLSGILVNLNESEVEVRYKIARLATAFPYLNTLESLTPDYNQYRGILVTKVLAEKVKKKVKPREWVWNQDLNTGTGLATFDF